MSYPSLNRHQRIHHTSTTGEAIPIEKVPGHYIDTSRVEGWKQEVLPSLVSGFNLAYCGNARVVFDHIKHISGGTGRSILDLIVCSSGDEREELLKILNRAGYSGVQPLDEVPPTSLE